MKISRENNLYFAAFVPGLQNLIADVLKERLSDLKIHKMLDGAVLFETALSYDKLNFFCFNNIFAVIDIKENILTQSSAEKNSISNIDYLEKHMEEIIDKSTVNNIILKNSNNFKTFRMVFSLENKPTSVNENIKKEIEKYISRLSGLKVNRQKGDTEFWFLYRSEKDGENFSIFMKRLTIRPSWDKTLHKGELPPPLAWIMCRLARPLHTETLLDPFCGYGSIPNAALKHFHINKFIACDNDKEAFLYSQKKLKKYLSNENRKPALYQKDFFLLPSLIEKETVDAIITDPPWGHYKETEGDFYNKMFNTFFALLKKEGRVVLLCANTENVKASYEGFLHEKSVPILLSGKKAVIQVYVKNS